MKAIETRYNGHRFRSRTEARWAVLLDHLGVAYGYETEGYELGNAIRYLPDFYLPAEDVFLEIKGAEPLRTELHKAGLLAFHTQKTVVFAVGQPSDHDRAVLITPNFPPSDEEREWLEAAPDTGLYGRAAAALRSAGMAVAAPSFDPEVDKPFHSEHRYVIAGEPFQHLDYDPGRKRLAVWLGFSEEIATTYHEDQYGMEHLTKVGEAVFERRAFGIDHEHTYVEQPKRSKAMRAAVDAARSARFEFGESGAG